ncbi:LMO42 factor, partial [Polypterus senegalus]
MSWKRCAGCGGKIADRFLLYAMDSYWHSRCLKCSCCQAQLGEIGTSCYTKSGMILCRNDYIRLFGNSGACSACGQSIPASELVMRAQGNVYHLKCFTCSTCRNRLVPGDRFHYINGSLFCEHDRPTALINGHLNSLQTNPLLPDQKHFILYSVYEASYATEFPQKAINAFRVHIAERNPGSMEMLKPTETTSTEFCVLKLKTTNGDVSLQPCDPHSDSDESGIVTLCHHDPPVTFSSGCSGPLSHGEQSNRMLAFPFQVETKLSIRHQTPPSSCRYQPQMAY